MWSSEYDGSKKKLCRWDGSGYQIVGMRLYTFFGKNNHTQQRLTIRALDLSMLLIDVRHLVHVALKYIFHRMKSSRCTGNPADPLSSIILQALNSLMDCYMLRQEHKNCLFSWKLRKNCTPKLSSCFPFSPFSSSFLLLLVSFSLFTFIGFLNFDLPSNSTL